MFFLSALVKANGSKALQKVTDAVVGMDTEAATDAELHMQEAALSQVTLELAKFRSQAAHDHAAATDAQQRFDRMKSAAQKLNEQYQAETDATKKASLETSLNGLLGTLEHIKTELDQYNQASADTDKLVAETEVILQEKSQEITECKSKLAQATRDLEAAKMAEQHSKEMADHAAELAGLRGGQVDGLNAALSSMQRQTEAAHVNAEASRMKADVLKHAEAGGMDDPNVKAALAAVSSPSTQSFSDRISALG